MECSTDCHLVAPCQLPTLTPSDIFMALRHFFIFFLLPLDTVAVIYLFSFGGGPTVNRLSACKPCIQEAERLHRRQQLEKQAFLEVSFVSRW